MIKMQVKSLKSLAHFHVHDIAGVIQQVDAISRQGQSLSYAMKRLDSDFSKLYPNYAEQHAQDNYQQTYTNWHKTTMNTLKSSLKSIGLTTAELEKEKLLLEKLNTQSQSAAGSKQVMQVANSIAQESVGQLQTLKRIIAAQANAQTAFMAQRVSQSSYEQKSLQTLIDSTETVAPTHHKQFGLIETF